MTSCKMNPTFSEIDFYDYKIRMCMNENTKMYLVSDLLRQYNEMHNTNKRFKKYLENKQAQELIEHMAKRTQNTVGLNSGPTVKRGSKRAEYRKRDYFSRGEFSLTKNRGYFCRR